MNTGVVQGVKGQHPLVEWMWSALVVNHSNDPPHILTQTDGSSLKMKISNALRFSQLLQERIH